MAIDPSLFNERMQGTLSTLLGLRIVEASPDRVVMSWTVGPQHLQPYGIVHGGARRMSVTLTGSAGANAINGGAGNDASRAGHHHPLAAKLAHSRSSACPPSTGMTTPGWTAAGRRSRSPGR